jgi:diaminopimelate decarboxylase
MEVIAGWRERYGVTLAEINVGGGMAIPYTHEDRPLDPAGYGTALAEEVAAAAARLRTPIPRLFVEPGRALVGPSAVTLYRVGTVKRIPGIRTYAAVDGGMSDNIRPALYGAEHEVAPVGRPSAAPPEAMTVVGKHCESGDLVREHAPLPSDLAPGDLLAVAATGAYTESMASTYNRVPRPGAVVVLDGSVRWIVRPETYKDLVTRDLPL